MICTPHLEPYSEDSSVMSAGDLNERRKSKYAEKDVLLSWRNLTVQAERKLPKKGFWSRQKKETFSILKNVNGYARSGVLTAIMGASGAGKTTLLTTISHRAKLDVSGDILVNGRNLSRELMTKLSGFVPQNDLVYKTLYVKEHMEFMARLMMDQRVRKIHRNRRIYCLLSELGLLRCCHTRLGDLSGGELKRLSLAVQLLTDPPILFCDEPTTGLDSYSAGVVLENLRSFAERGKAVICTIHQPASGHFELFHEVLLLAVGRVAYLGSVGEASSYFNSVGLVCPSTYNPAEFYVQQLAVLPGKETECQGRNNWLCDQFAKSLKGQELETLVTEELYRKNGSNGIPTKGLVKGNWSTHSSTTSESLLDTDLENEKEFSTYVSVERPHRFIQIWWLTWRSYKDLVRNCADTVLRFAFFMLIALFIATPYIGITHQNFNQNTIQNMQGFMYLIITEAVFTFSYSVFHTFPAELPVLLRELGNGLYEPGPYYLSKMVILLPKSMIEAIFYSVFIFWVADLKGGFIGCVVFTIPIIFAALSATAYGSLMSAAFESVATASLVSVPLEMLGIMFCGLYLQLTALSPYISWIKYLSQFYYGQEAVSITQWHQIEHIECSEDPTLPCISDGDGVLNKYGYDRYNYGTDLLGLGSIYCGAHFLGFLALWRRSRQQAIY